MIYISAIACIQQMYCGNRVHFETLTVGQCGVFVTHRINTNVELKKEIVIVRFALVLWRLRLRR